MNVLLLCLGNICRSPTAHGVMRSMAAHRELSLRFDSAGTGGWHVGAPPDPRALSAAYKRGYDLSDLRARQLSWADFTRFELILAMDARNLADARASSPPDATAATARFLDFAGIGGDVPDPYLVGGFDEVVTLIERASTAALDRLSNGDLR
ncbi:MAG: protein-tyrosine phosphatase [Rhodobacteraceae bacterium HLUCCA12]|nr:MAG: protein-tyrosine phosphatase [Rhodobacteraceae bacterium HLUCCA12]